MMETQTPFPDHCLKDDCKIRTRKKDDVMIRCVICCVRHHIECVSVPKEQAGHIWTCFLCRRLAETVGELKNKLVNMHTQQTEMKNLLDRISTQLAQEKEARNTAEIKLDEVKNVLSNLNAKITDDAKVCQDNPKDTTLSTAHIIPTAPPLPCLLLGTSLLRNIDPNNLHDCEVIAKGGATVSDLHAAIDNLPDDKSYSQVTIVAGSIDIESKTVAEVITDYLALITAASLKAEKIAICSILPRTDRELTEKTTLLNNELKKTCLDEGHVFCDMDDTFRLRNGKANQACLLPDGLHLTKFGVDLLIQGCEVQLKPGTSTAYCEKSYKGKVSKDTSNKQHLFKGHESPFSNFFPIPGLYVDGIPFKTTEAAYVYHKALFHGDNRTADAVKNSHTGIHAKRLGDKIITNTAWQQKRVDIMDNLVRIKLQTSQTVRKALKDTGDQHLIEDTPNAFWGRGNNGQGENMLGRLWMLHRSKLDYYERHQNTHHTWATRNRQPKCFRCGEPGHLIHSCRQREDLKCWNCLLPGHKQKHCRRIAQRLSR